MDIVKIVSSWILQPSLTLVQTKKKEELDMGKSLRQKDEKWSNRFKTERNMRQRNYFGAMMVETGGQTLGSGLTRNYPNVIKPALHVIGKAEGVNKVGDILQTKQGPMFFADTTVNVNPSAEEILRLPTNG